MSNTYYVSPHFGGETYCFCPVRLSVTQFVSATPLKLQNRISWNLVGSKDTICSCAYYQDILISWILWELCPFELRNFPKFTTEAACQCNSPKLCGSYAPLNLKISRNILLKQLVSATPLKLLNRISWNLVGSKDTICSCAYYQEILIFWILLELCPFELRNFPKFTTEAACQCNSSETNEQNFMKLGR